MRSFRDGLDWPTIITHKKPITRSFKDGFSRPVLPIEKQYALLFDGTNDRVNMSEKVIPGGYKNIIIDFARDSGSLDETNEIILGNAGRATANKGDDIYIDSSGHINWLNLKESVGNNRFHLTGTTDFRDGLRHVLQFIWDGTTNANAVKIYIGTYGMPLKDFMLEVQGTANATETSQGTLDLFVGYNSRLTAEYFTGKINRITMQNASIYIARYPFREGKGTVLHDISDNKYDGVITGATWVEL